MKVPFIVALAIPGVGMDPDVAASIVWAICKHGGEFGIRSVKLEMDRIVVQMDHEAKPERTSGSVLMPMHHVNAPEVKQALAEQLAKVVQSAVTMAMPRSPFGVAGRVLDMGDWAFGADKKALTPEQRAAVREEVLAMLADSAPYEQKTVQRIADRLGKRK